MIIHYPSQEAIDLFKKRTNHHIELVQNNICLFQESGEYNDIFDELALRASSHDRSKFSEPELTPYIWLTWKYHCEWNNIPFKLPIGMDQKIRDAKFHHFSNNRHHPEWHFDLNDMTIVDLIEMVCDWKAAGQEFGEKSLVGYANRVLGKKLHFDQKKINLIYKLIHKIDRMVEEEEKAKKRLKEITPSNKELLKMVERQNYPKPEIMVSEKLSKEELLSFDKLKGECSPWNNPQGYPFKYTFASEYFDFIIVTDGYSDSKHPMTGKEFDLIFKVGKKDGITQPAVTREELKNLADFIYKVLNSKKFAEFKERLSSVIKEEHIENWLQTLNKSFDNRKPIDLVNEGNFDPLFKMLQRLERRAGMNGQTI